MEIQEITVTQERLKAYHETSKYKVYYEVTLGENKTYQSINGTIKDATNDQIVGYISKSYELSIRVVNGKESLLGEISQLAAETLALLDEEIKKLS